LELLAYISSRQLLIYINYSRSLYAFSSRWVLANCKVSCSDGVRFTEISSGGISFQWAYVVIQMVSLKVKHNGRVNYDCWLSSTGQTGQSLFQRKNSILLKRDHWAWQTKVQLFTKSVNNRT